MDEDINSVFIKILKTSFNPKCNAIFYIFSPLITNSDRSLCYINLIDNIYCTMPKISTHCKAGLIKLSISDHCAIFCISKIHQFVIEIVLSQREAFVIKMYTISIVI